MGIINNLQSLHSKNCVFCGLSFKPTHPAEKFCGNKCRKEYRNEYQREYRKRHKKEHNEYSKRWSKDHRVLIGKNRRKRIIRYRRDILNILGNKCSNPNCPIPNKRLDRRALQIDHIHGGGNEERTKSDSEMYYKNILERIKSGSKDYQLLCAYCNWMKRYKNNEVKGVWF